MACVTEPPHTAVVFLRLLAYVYPSPACHKADTTAVFTLFTGAAGTIVSCLSPIETVNVCDCLVWNFFANFFKNQKQFELQGKTRKSRAETTPTTFAFSTMYNVEVINFSRHRTLTYFGIHNFYFLYNIIKMNL